MNTMNMDIDSLEDTNTFWPATLPHRHHHHTHQAQHVSFADSPSGPSKYTHSLVHTSPLSYSSNSLDDEDDDWIPDTPLTPLTPLDRHEDDKRRVRSDSVPSLCHSASTASSPDQDDFFTFPDDDEDYEFHEGKSPTNLSPDSDEEPEGEDIAPFPPSFTPPTFYYSPAPTSSSSPGCSSLLSSSSVAAQSHELSGLLNLQRRTQEDLARLDDAVQLHSSVSNGNATILGSLKSRRKAVKEKSKEIEGLIRFGVDKLGGEPTYSASVEDDDGSQTKRSWGSAAALLSFSPTPPPTVAAIPGMSSPPPPLSLDTTSPSASPSSLLFPTLPSPSTQKSQKQKKEPPSSVDNLLSRMILGRRDQDGVKARNILESSVGRTCDSRRRSSLSREVLPLEESDSDEKNESMDVDYLLPSTEYAVDRQCQGQDPVNTDMGYREDLEMDEDEDLDELGLTGFD